MERAITDREIFIAEFEDEIYKTKGVSEDLENVLKEYQSDDHDLSQVLETLNNALELNSQIQFFIQERKDEAEGKKRNNACVLSIILSSPAYVNKKYRNKSSRPRNPIGNKTKRDKKSGSQREPAKLI